MLSLNELKNPKDAIKDFSKAIEISPKVIANWYTRGILYDDNLDNNKKALEDYNKAIKIDYNYVDAINTIGLIYLEEKKGLIEKKNRMGFSN